MAGLVASLLVAGAVNGVGPLARATPPTEVTDPREILARSAQSVIDASSVHVAASVTGRVPGGLVGRQDATVALDGTLVSLDVRPQDARAHLAASSPPLGLQVEAVTSWDTMAYRIGAGAWTEGSLAGLVANTGIDANPLTLVDRMRDWLALPGAPVPASTNIACDAPSGVCHRVTLALGPEAGRVLLAAFAGVNAAGLGGTSTDVVLLTDAATLRPAHLVATTRNAGGSLAVTLKVDFSQWDWPSVIPDPPGG